MFLTTPLTRSWQKLSWLLECTAILYFYFDINNNTTVLWIGNVFSVRKTGISWENSIKSAYDFHSYLTLISVILTSHFSYNTVGRKIDVLALNIYKFNSKFRCSTFYKLYNPLASDFVDCTAVECFVPLPRGLLSCISIERCCEFTK
jgi:hypothetical protein